MVPRLSRTYCLTSGPADYGGGGCVAPAATDWVSAHRSVPDAIAEPENVLINGLMTVSLPPAAVDRGDENPEQPQDYDGTQPEHRAYDQ